MTRVNKNGYVEKNRGNRKKGTFSKGSGGDPTVHLVKTITCERKMLDGTIYTSPPRAVVDLGVVTLPSNLIGRRVRFTLEIVNDPKEKKPVNIKYYGKVRGGET